MWHNLFGEFLRFLVSLFVIDQDLADVVGQVVAERPHNRIALAINKERRRPFHHDHLDGFPDGEQIFEIPGEFLRAAIDAGRAQDDTHSLGDVDIVQRLACQVPVLTDNAPGNTTGVGLVGFQYDESSCETDKRRQCGALVATFFLVDLDNDVLAFVQDVLYVRLAAGLDVGNEIFAGDFLQRQKAVALGAVIDERGLETWLDARYLSFVDIGLFTFARR